MSGFNLLCGANKLKRSGGVGYTKPGKTVFTAELNGGLYGGVGAIALQGNESYVVTTDKDKFEATCVEVHASGNVTLRWVGNGHLALPSNLYDTGESFCVYYADQNGTITHGAIDANGGSHITVSLPETVHTIDPKYLPGICLPVVEITTPLSADFSNTTVQSTILNETDTAAIKAALGLPCLYVFWLGAKNATIFSPNFQDGDTASGHFYTADSFHINVDCKESDKAAHFTIQVTA